MDKVQLPQGYRATTMRQFTREPFGHIICQITDGDFQRTGQLLPPVRFEGVINSNVIGISLSIFSNNKWLEFGFLVLKKEN